MVFQTLKFFLVRVGLSVFLMITLGFGALYFFHEVALPHARVDDTLIQWLLSFVCLFLGFFAYGLFGEHSFDDALRSLKGAGLEGMKEKEIIRQFDDLLAFTFSSYFLPGRGRRMRKEVVREYASYLHSIGKDDPAALRIYLKAFLQNPDDPRYRVPLLSVLKRADKLRSAEIDLLLVMLKTEAGVDKIVASHLASVFLEQKRFNRKTEPVFLAAVENADENAGEIIRFVLPRLLAKNRSDEYALNFYLQALAFHPPEEAQLREIIGESFCHGHWEAVSPELHEKCGEIFNELEQEQQEKILRQVKESSVSEKWKNLKLFMREDVKDLERLKLRLGIIKSGFAFFRDGVLELARILRILVKKAILKLLDGLILFNRSSLRFKLVSLFLSVVLVVGVAGLWKIQQQKSIATGKTAGGSLVGGASSKDSGVRKIHTIQIAAVTYKKKADRMVKKLRKKGIKRLYVVKTRRRTGGYWYKIRLEKFDNKNDAQRYADRLIARKIIKNYFIVTYVPQSP
ncbi:MAG: SPOR domain-containing protein [Nitrospinales bacterium]